MHKKIKSPLLWLILIPTLSSAMTLDDYLGQVKAKNGMIKSVDLSAEAKSLRLDEASLIFKPSLFITGERSDDMRPTNAPSFQGTETIRDTIRAGVSQTFRTGTKASLSYNYYRTEIVGAAPGVLPTNEFIDVSPMIEVTQSLWRNFMGSEFQAQEILQNAQNEAQRYNDLFAKKQLLMQAENAYWRLYFAQNSLRVQEQSLDRAVRLREWNSKRVKDNLVDESELLQADANLQNRQMELQDTITEVEAALQEFNTMREDKGDIKLDADKNKGAKYVLNASLPPKVKLREDVLARLASNKAAIASSELGSQRNRPNLEFYANYSINGRNSQYSEAWQQAMGADRPYSIFGLRFSTPLDFGALSSYRESYSKDVLSAELGYKRRLYEVDKEWDILAERFENLKQRLRLSQKLVAIQEKKLLAEKRRYQQGRTTTFLVLQFEQDFANSQLVNLRNERELISVYNQLKLFTGAAHE